MLMFQQLREVLTYKEMLFSTVRKDLRSRYRGSVLGFLWTFINPLMQLIVYAFVFKHIMRSVDPNYTMYIFTGLLPWIYCSSSIQISTTSIVTNANLVKKIYFPRMILPISVSATGLINYLFGLVIVFPALLLTGVHLTPYAFLMPIIMAVQFLFVTGMCMIMSALYVFFRDLEHIVSIIIMVWFYLTPVLYPISMFPEKYQKFLELNPMAHIVMAYRNVLMYETHPFNLGFIIVIFISVAVFFIGAFIFSKLQRNFAEEL